MKTVLAGLFALFTFFTWQPQTVFAACCNTLDAAASCQKNVGCVDGQTRCDTTQQCQAGGYNGGTQPPAGTAPGTGQAGTATGFSPFDGCQNNEVNTAIGCIPTDPSAFIGKFLSLGIGMAGGIAFLLILFGGFQILTSTGNPEQLNAGRELVGSAVTGLLLIIFSLFLLRLIGYNILGIPGFG